MTLEQLQLPTTDFILNDFYYEMRLEVCRYQQFTKLNDAINYLETKVNVQEKNSKYFDYWEGVKNRGKIFKVSNKTNEFLEVNFQNSEEIPFSTFELLIQYLEKNAELLSKTDLIKIFKDFTIENNQNIVLLEYIDEELCLGCGCQPEPEVINILQHNRTINSFINLLNNKNILSEDNLITYNTSNFRDRRCMDSHRNSHIDIFTYINLNKILKD